MLVGSSHESGALLRLIRAEALARRVDAVLAATPKFGCLMAMCPSLDSELPNWAAAHIPADALAADGVEMEPHVTVLYGFALDFDSSKLAGLLRRPDVRLGPVTRFECPEYDVLKVDVASKDLEELHAELAERFKDRITPSKWDYHPHLTIAYVKKGACRELDGNKDFEGRQVHVGQMLYSLPEKQGRRVFDVVQATEQGHPFFGNQWTRYAKDAANDPAGNPKGRIKHAVLIIGGKRYRGPSHFQALMGWAAKHGEGAGLPKHTAEGFETESGHFLDREQAAEYAYAHGLIKDTGEHADRVERTGELRSEALYADGHIPKLAASGGRLYTRDMVQAAGFDESKHPRDASGHWSEISGFASRFKPSEKFVFKKPLIGPSGRALTAYEWKFKPEEYVDKYGEDRIRRVSDWDEAEDSSETGRGLVHHFHVEDLDKTSKLVSAESVPVLLGYTENNLSPAKAKSVMSAVKTLAKLKMKLAIVEDKIAHNESVWKEVEKLRFPSEKVASRKAFETSASTAQRFYLDGNEGVMQVQHDQGPATSYTLESLEQQWRAGYAKAMGEVHISESRFDLQRRIKRQERKIEQAIENPVSASDNSPSNSVQAADWRLSAHDAARDGAEAAVASGFARMVGLLEREAVTDRQEAEERVAEELAIGAALFLLAHEDAAYAKAAQNLREAAGLHTGASPAERSAFGEARERVLRPVARRVALRLVKTARAARSAGAPAADVSSRVVEEGREIEAVEGPLVASTEAQAIYGSAQERTLRDAGFTHKVWTTMDDDRVRESHRQCEEQGAVPMHARFANGLRFPGDPEGPPEEVCGCRCWLTGAGRVKP